MVRFADNPYVSDKIRSKMSVIKWKMACGIGICLVCTCKIKAEEEGIPFEHKRCCKDGPVFDSKEVIW